jgi:hypothetical protein
LPCAAGWGNRREPLDSVIGTLGWLCQVGGGGEHW